MAGSVEDLQAAVRHAAAIAALAGQGVCGSWRPTDQAWHRDRAKPPGLQLLFTIGRRTLLGWLVWAMPATLARTTWWVGPAGPPRPRAAWVRTHGRTRDGRRQWNGAHDLHSIVAASAALGGVELGALRAVYPLVGFGFVPGRPSLVQLSIMIEAVRSETDGDTA